MWLLVRSEKRNAGQTSGSRLCLDINIRFSAGFDCYPIDVSLLYPRNVMGICLSSVMHHRRMLVYIPHQD